ncbi:hypothetical protein KKF34_11555 [Myxococcota bacterium]|nr:hypothetical protein [Myxococcota bacterium]MBU1379179.1 hypothetical protein [Myxococcota bacterium]MBU1497499.1 hypothetical protein [Myxococcota bacterium]
MKSWLFFITSLFVFAAMGCRDKNPSGFSTFISKIDSVVIPESCKSDSKATFEKNMAVGIGKLEWAVRDAIARSGKGSSPDIIKVAMAYTKKEIAFLECFYKETKTPTGKFNSRESNNALVASRKKQHLYKMLSKQLNDELNKKVKTPVPPDYIPENPVTPSPEILPIIEKLKIYEKTQKCSGKEFKDKWKQVSAKVSGFQKDLEGTLKNPSTSNNTDSLALALAYIGAQNGLCSCLENTEPGSKEQLCQTSAHERKTAYDAVYYRILYLWALRVERIPEDQIPKRR